MRPSAAGLLPKNTHDSEREARRRDRFDEIAWRSQLLRLQTPRNRRDDNKIERRYNEDMLSSVAEREIRRVPGVSCCDPPLVTIASPGTRGIPGALPGRGRSRIVRVDDLLAVPLTITQIEQPQLEHVPRRQLQSRPGADLTLGRQHPVTRSNAERLEQDVFSVLFKRLA